MKHDKEKTGIGIFLTKYWLLIFTILIALLFGGMEPAFFYSRNLLNLLSSACINGITAIGLTCIMAAGELDFACGVELTAGAILMAKFCNGKITDNYIVGFLLTIGVLVLIGLINALLHVKIGIPAFIATMGTSYFIRGILKWITDAKGIYNSSNWPDCFTFLGQGYLFNIVPMPLVVLVIVSILMIIYTEKMTSGKLIYAVGSNYEACRYLGINAGRQKTISFVLCSVLCGLAGIVQGSMVNGAIFSMGDSAMPYAVTILNMGAMFIKMGVFNVPGTVIGAILIAVINNGLTMIGAESFMKDIVMAVVMLLSISIVSVIRLNASQGRKASIIIKKTDKITAA